MNDTIVFPQSKACTRCKQTKPLTEFYRNKKSRDGRTAYCIACWSEYRKERYKNDPKFRQAQIEKATQWNSDPENAERLKLYRREYARRGYVKQKDAAYRYTAAYRKRNRQANRDYRQRHPLKSKARSRLNYLVRRGDIPKISTCNCAKCGKQAHHYHHYLGYEKKHWADVKPYCRSCHHELHNKERDSLANPFSQ